MVAAPSDCYEMTNAGSLRIMGAQPVVWVALGLPGNFIEQLFPPSQEFFDPC